MRVLSLLVLFGSLWLPAPMPAAPLLRTDSLSFAGFGEIHLYEPAEAPRSVVLFISGDGGWKNGVVDMAGILSRQGALVAGIDIRRYFKSLTASAEKCFYPAGALEELSKVVQQRAHLSAYLPPVLVGSSSGATLVYAALAEAPAGTFLGGISLGFCPDLETAKEPCEGNGLRSYRVSKPVPAWMLEPDPALRTPWYVLQGVIDQCCQYDQAAAFARQIPGAQLVSLPNVGHGFSVPKNWEPQFSGSFQNILRTTAQRIPDQAASAATEPDPLHDLPLVVTPPTGKTAGKQLAILLSGDGGWKDFDQSIADGFAARGIPAIGLNTLQYFWKARTPESAAWDLTRVIRYYSDLYHTTNVQLVGYSFGAEVLPFLYNRLNDKDKQSVTGMALLSPGDRADFEFHFSSWLNRSSSTARLLEPELVKMGACPTLFLFGSEEAHGWVNPLIKGRFALKTLSGDHHYDGNTAGVVEALKSL